MRNKLRDMFCFTVFVVAIITLTVGCNSSSTGNDGPALETPFVADETNTGSFKLEVKSSTVSVGETTRFVAEIRDVSGNPVPNVRVSCDTEKGLALIEPATGTSLSDGFGNISGTIGCEAPGSFRIGCRLPLGFAAREFSGVLCEGDLPAGFTGFPEAGGGGLGGGVDTSEEEGDSALGIRLSGVTFSDTGDGTSTTSIDITQISDCDGDSDTFDPEPFFDATVSFTIQNNSNELVRFTAYRYTVSNFDGSGSSYTSPRIRFVGENLSVDSDGGEGTAVALFADASGSGKRFFGRSDTISTAAAGFKNISFTIFGETAGGESITLTGSSAASFDSFSRC